MTKSEEWETVVQAARSLGRLHGLVNNAGIRQIGRLLETSEASFMRHVAVNQLGCFLGMQHVAKALIEPDGGSIVNISSTAGLRGAPHIIAYTATKWAVRGMTKAAALDLAEHNIRVNSLHPGRIESPMQDIYTSQELEQRAMTIPAKRFGTPEDVTGAVLFLLSDESCYVTGAEFPVDGGFSL